MIRRANGKDIEGLKAFLSRAGLGTAGVTEETAGNFLLLENKDRSWRGTLGLEPYQENGLLRSLVVTAGQAEKDLFLLFEHIIMLAKEKNIQHLFLAAKQSAAVSLLQIMGFHSVDKEELPEPLFQSAHINHIINVDNSIFLKYSL
jgi:amino-acid N-acetyltransferase